MSHKKYFLLLFLFASFYSHDIIAQVLEINCDKIKPLGIITGDIKLIDTTKAFIKDEYPLSSRHGPSTLKKLYGINNRIE